MSSPEAGDRTPSQNVGVVTVTYGSRAALLERTVAAALDSGVGRVVVVANGVHADARDAVRSIAASERRVTLVESDENLGSAGGYELGMRQMMDEPGVELLWLLDDDNVPACDALERLLSERATRLSQHESHRLVLAALRPSRAYLVQAAAGDVDGAFPRPSSFLGFHWLDLPRKVVRRVVGRRPSPQPGEEPVEIPYAPYGGLLLAKETLAGFGLPNREFYLYGDDTEFTRRLEKNGCRIVLVPVSRVEDIDSAWQDAVTGTFIGRLLRTDSADRVFYSVRNQAYLDTHYGARSRLSFLANRTLLLVACDVAALFGGRRERAQLVRSAARRGVRGELGQVDAREIGR